MSAPATIYTEITQSKNAVAILAEVKELLSQVEKLGTIETEEQAAAVGEFRQQISVRKRELDNERKEMVAPALQIQRSLNDKFKEPLAELDRIKGSCDKLLLEWTREQERIAREAEQARLKKEQEEREAEEARIEAERLAQLAETEDEVLEAQAAVEESIERTDSVRQQVVPKAPEKTGQVTGTQGAKVSKVDNWKYRIVDINAVPEEFLRPPEERVNKLALNKVAKSQKGEAEVAGIEFYNEPHISSR